MNGIIKQCDYRGNGNSEGADLTTCKLTSKICILYTRPDISEFGCPGYDLPRDLAVKVQEANKERQKKNLDSKFIFIEEKGS